MGCCKLRGTERCHFEATPLEPESSVCQLSFHRRHALCRSVSSLWKLIVALLSPTQAMTAQSGKSPGRTPNSARSSLHAHTTAASSSGRTTALLEGPLAALMAHRLMALALMDRVDGLRSRNMLCTMHLVSAFQSVMLVGLLQGGHDLMDCLGGALSRATEACSYSKVLRFAAIGRLSVCTPRLPCLTHIASELHLIANYRAAPSRGSVWTED